MHGCILQSITSEVKLCLFTDVSSVGRNRRVQKCTSTYAVNICSFWVHLHLSMHSDFITLKASCGNVASSEMVEGKKIVALSECIVLTLVHGFHDSRKILN